MKSQQFKVTFHALLSLMFTGAAVAVNNSSTTISCDAIADVKIGMDVGSIVKPRIVRRFKERTDAGGEESWVRVRSGSTSFDVELDSKDLVRRIRLKSSGIQTVNLVGVGTSAADVVRKENVSAVVGDGQELILVTPDACGISFVTNWEVPADQLGREWERSALLHLPKTVQIKEIFVVNVRQ